MAVSTETLAGIGGHKHTYVCGQRWSLTSSSCAMFILQFNLMLGV